MASDSPPARRPIGFRFDHFEADLRTRRLLGRGKPLAIDPRVFDALAHLIENRDRLVSKQQLLDEVWEGAFVSDNALTRAITRLRRALDDDSRHPRYIETVHGRGYRFVAAAEPVFAPGDGAGRAVAAGRRRWVMAGAAAAAVLLSAAALWWSATRSDQAALPAAGGGDAATRLDPLRVAVLPLVNLATNGEAEDRYFADGLTEQLISVLSHIEGVRVISSTTTMTYRGARRRIGEIARELGTGTLLEGSVRRSGGELRITVKLIEAPSEELLWSRDFDTRLDDVFAVQSEIAARVAEALQRSIPESAVARIREGPTREMNAYDHYLKGRLAYREVSRAGNETAVRHYERALEVDPSFALARAGLANAYAMRTIRFGFGDEQRRAAEAAARQALALDPLLPEAYKALGIVAYSRGEMRRSLEYNEKALAINPSYDEALYNAASSAHYLGRLDKAVRYQIQATDFASGRAALVTYLLILGFEEEGRVLAARVLQEEPLTGYLNLNLASWDTFFGDPDAARARVSRIIAAEPSWARAHETAGDLELWQGNLAAARAHYREAVELSSSGAAEARLRLFFLDRREGRDRSEELGAIEQRHLGFIAAGAENSRDHWILGTIDALRGRPDAAIEHRQEAIRLGWRSFWRDASDPLLEPLRNDPRFHRQLELMRRDIAAMRERVRADVERALARLL